MLFILYATGKCNLKCSYCGGSFDPNVVPWEVKYPLKFLESIFREGDSIAFYGGEPLLNIDFIKEVMKTFNASHYIIQTNGLLLGELERELLSKVDAILVSIDGGRWITDRNRGRGIYEKVLHQVRKLRSRGFSGDVIARMTATEESDIYRDVNHLLSLNLFDHVHWQLSMVWVERKSWRDLWSWINKSYKPGLKKLFNEWISNLRRGKILGIAPFQGVLKRILLGGTYPPCGSGIDSFAILTDGRVISCPIAVRERWAEIGRLGEISRKDLERRKPIVNEPCKSCGYLEICGTRCLYTHVERLWGEEGVKAVCECSKHLIDLVKNNLEEVREALDRSNRSLDDVIYPRFNNTVEIMP